MQSFEYKQYKYMPTFDHSFHPGTISFPEPAILGKEREALG
jgi:hypothetical protein